MASKEALPIDWIIETLADLKQADTSILRALIASVRNFSTDTSEAIRERVALRYLEELLGSRGGDARAISGSSPGIDVSRSSEEVLCSHLKKVATCTLERGGSELCSHDQNQFILRKRAALPKSSLEQLKESILEVRCQAALSLKELSGLSWPNQVDYNPQSKGGDGENRSLIQDSVTLAPNSGGLILHEEPSGSEKHFPELDVRNDPCRNIGFTGGNDVQLSENEKYTRLNDGEIHSLNQGAVPVLDSPSISLQNQLLPVQNVSDCNKRQSSLPQPTCKENISLQHAPSNGRKKDIDQPHCKNDHFDCSPSVVMETSSDDDDSDFDPNDEMFTKEKHRLLSSQVHTGDDSISSDWTEQSLCIRCDKGGQLLSCNAIGCSVAFHESCFEPLAHFKETRVFYCPFCSYTRSAIAYCKARKNVFRARKVLSDFIGGDLVQGHRKKPTPARVLRGTSQSGVVGKEKDRQTEAANVCSKVDSQISDVSHKAVEINQLSYPANTTDNGKLPCSDKVTSPVGQNADVTLINGEGEVGNNCEHIGVGDPQQPAEPHAEKNNCDLADEDDEELDAYQIRYRDVSRAKGEDGIGVVDDHVQLRKLRKKEQVEYVPASGIEGEELTRQPSERPAKRSRKDTDVGKIHHHRENVKNLKREKSSSGMSSRRAVRPKHYSNPMPTLGRRTTLFWTPEEEEALKDAVKKFAPDSDGNLPWTKILEFGRRIFHTTRQPGDLKDKWRNIRKKKH